MLRDNVRYGYSSDFMRRFSAALAPKDPAERYAIEANRYRQAPPF